VAEENVMMEASVKGSMEVREVEALAGRKLLLMKRPVG